MQTAGLGGGNMVDELTGLDRINNELVSGWTARLTAEGRIYYIK